MNVYRKALEMPKGWQYTAVAITLVAMLAISPRQSSAEGLNWTIAPYLWASDVGLDVTVESDPVIGTDVPFSDLVDKLDGAFMGHFEVSAVHFGGFFDTIYIKLADSQVVTVAPGGPFSGDVSIDTDLTLKLNELAGFYRMGSPDPGMAAFDILLGARLVDMDLNLDIVLPGPGGTPLNGSINISETDVFFGGRVIGQFNQKWHYKLRADYGTGGTEGTFNGLAAVGYSFGKTGLFSIDLGYRYLTMELKDDSDGTVTKTDITMSGPIVGFIFSF